jgi:hypothetical protein
MKERVGLEHEFISRECGKRHADQTDLSDAEDCRKKNFSKMKAKAGRDIQAGIEVMNVMESPKNRNFMIRDMPIVKTQVQQEKARDELHPTRSGHELHDPNELKELDDVILACDLPEHGLNAGDIGMKRRRICRAKVSNTPGHR